MCIADTVQSVGAGADSCVCSTAKSFGTLPDLPLLPEWHMPVAIKQYIKQWTEAAYERDSLDHGGSWDHGIDAAPRVLRMVSLHLASGLPACWLRRDVEAGGVNQASFVFAQNEEH